MRLLQRALLLEVDENGVDAGLHVDPFLPPTKRSALRGPFLMTTPSDFLLQLIQRPKQTTRQDKYFAMAPLVLSPSIGTLPALGQRLRQWHVPSIDRCLDLLWDELLVWPTVEQDKLNIFIRIRA